MSIKDNVCTISGMRPHKLPQGLNLAKLQERLEEAIRQSVAAGYMKFQTGMAMGADIWASEIILRLKEEFPGVRLRCCLPCETQSDRWSGGWRERYFRILSAADEVTCLQDRYTSGCMQQRNCHMVDGSSRLIAVYDEASGGGTAQTVNYARGKGLAIVIINPLGFRQLEASGC